MLVHDIILVVHQVADLAISVSCLSNIHQIITNGISNQFNESLMLELIYFGRQISRIHT